MDQSRDSVKRRYESPRRARQAEQTRNLILDVARRRFLADGLVVTTVRAIAEEVGVSVDTIYKTFGGKPGLVRAICERDLAGDGPVHAEVRSDELQATESDSHAIMRGFGRLIVEVAPKVAPVMLLLRDAAVTDPDMAQLRVELGAARLRRMRHNARQLSSRGHLRAGISVEQAAEIMWTYTSEELYEMLVVRRGWSVRRLATFAVAAMSAALLD